MSAPPHFWQPSWRADPRSARIADRHYNRQKIGAPHLYAFQQPPDEMPPPATIGLFA